MDHLRGNNETLIVRSYSILIVSQALPVVMVLFQYMAADSILLTRISHNIRTQFLGYKDLRALV